MNENVIHMHHLSPTPKSNAQTKVHLHKTDLPVLFQNRYVRGEARGLRVKVNLLMANLANTRTTYHCTLLAVSTGFGKQDELF